ncbi:MAG: hypothetical protein V8Q45_05210 [Alistipes onderdonkii]
MLPLIALAAISIASSIAGGISANKKQRKADQILSDRERNLKEWYNSEMNMPYLDRADSRAMLKRIRDYNEDELKAMNTNAVKSGATDEAKVAAANELNKNYSQTLAQIGGLGEQHKDQVRRDCRARMDNLTGTRYQAQLGKAAGAQDPRSTGIGSCLGQLAMLYGMGSGSGGGLANFAGGK